MIYKNLCHCMHKIVRLVRAANSASRGLCLWIDMPLCIIKNLFLSLSLSLSFTVITLCNSLQAYVFASLEIHDIWQCLSKNFLRSLYVSLSFFPFMRWEMKLRVVNEKLRDNWVYFECLLLIRIAQIDACFAWNSLHWTLGG